MLRRTGGGTAGLAAAMLLLGACASPSGAISTAPAVAPATFSAERLSDHIRVLASDAYGGRYPASEGEALTLAYLQAQYETLDLEPGGPGGQWLQPVDLKRYAPRTASAAWIGPDGQSHALDPEQGLVVRAAANDGVATVADAPLVFAGYGVHAPERAWDDYGEADVRGAVVVVLPGEPATEAFNGSWPTLYAGESYKIAEALRRGAVGVLVLGPPAEGAAWAGAARGRLRPDTIAPGRDGIEFTGAVAADLAGEWARMAGLDLDGLMTGRDSGAFRAARLEGVRLSVDVAEDIEIIRTHNLLARIPGTERPDETVIFSAHWDHVGSRDEPDAEGDHIYNGAWDNASGTAGLLEMARVLAAGPRPERSIVFAHMTAEEMGLLGAHWYASHPVYPLETTVADLNIDMLPLSPPTRDLPIFGRGQNTLEDDLAALAAEEGRYVSDDGQPEQGFYYRSDHFPFALAGVPALMPWHGVDWVDGGREAGLAAYRAQFRTYYHRRADEWRPDLDYRSALENLELLRRLALDLANSRRWPQWKPLSEFAATRAASEGTRR